MGPSKIFPAVSILIVGVVIAAAIFFGMKLIANRLAIPSGTIISTPASEAKTSVLLGDGRFATVDDGDVYVYQVDAAGHVHQLDKYYRWGPPQASSYSPASPVVTHPKPIAAPIIRPKAAAHPKPKSVAAPNRFDTPQMVGARAEEQRYEDWMNNASWTDDDAPYQAIRQQIDRMRQRGQLTAGVLAAYQARYEKSPNDLQALFAYGYASYRGDLPSPLLGMPRMPHSILHAAFEKGKSALPHTYNWTRLAYLSEWDVSWNFYEAGERLIQRDPKDTDVEFLLPPVFVFVPNLRSKGEQYQADLVRRFPHDPRTYMMLANVAASRTFLPPDQGNLVATLNDERKAIDDCNKALPLATPNSDYAAFIRFRIQILQGQEHFHELIVSHTPPAQRQPIAKAGSSG